MLQEIFIIMNLWVVQLISKISWVQNINNEFAAAGLINVCMFVQVYVCLYVEMCFAV